MLTSEVAEVFGAIRPVLPSSCVKRRTSRRRSSSRQYPADEQSAFYERILATLGFEEGSYRLDPTVHPFCTSFSTTGRAT